MGQGGFATVYKATWKHMVVAVKKISRTKIDPTTDSAKIEKIKIAIQQALTEVHYLSITRHDNILPIYGCCLKGDIPCIVYKYMEGGTLHQRLHKKTNQEPLTWKQRLTIAKGTANGLHFLHTIYKKPLIHGDIKPANILLDGCSYPMIGDFGLAREGLSLNSTMEVSHVYGTRPYLPNDFIENRGLSTKIDTYSFGVVLFEIVTALRPYDEERSNRLLTNHILWTSKNNVPLTNLIDSSCSIDSDGFKICQIMFELGLSCTSKISEARPEMDKVIESLMKV